MGTDNSRFVTEMAYNKRFLGSISYRAFSTEDGS